MKKPQEPTKLSKYASDYPPNENVLLKNIRFTHPDWIDNIDEYEDELPEKTEIREWWYKEIVFYLEDLLKLCGNKSPHKVKVVLHRDRAINFIDISVVEEIETNKEQWLKEKELEEKEYQTKLAKYKKELAEYEIFEAEENIKTAKENLRIIREKYNK